MTRAPARRRKRVAVVTGTRAEYGLLRSVMQAIRDHPQLTLQLAVTGMHLLPRFGRTIDEIRRDGWRVDARVRMQRGSDDATDQARGLSLGVRGLAEFFESARSDVVLVLGDRVEALAGALAGVTTGRIVAHIHGGDVALGDYDDSLRHAISKLAHVHFAATRAAARRLVRMGEESRRVHVVGAPGLDRLRALCSSDTPREREPVAVVVQHPTGREPRIEQRVAATVLDAVKRAGLGRCVIYPNSDRGSSGIVRAIERHARRHGKREVRVERSMPRDGFLRTLMGARLLVGNSSCGLIEAPFCGVAVVNVGDRQCSRQPGGRAIVHAGESAAQIERALRAALRLRPRARAAGVYGDGRAGVRIAQVLARSRFGEDTRRKLITY